ncbi:hypothetical protein SAMN05428944_3582 [Streptomyces sp. 1222.5]|uniref:hypothetical protein n=1 Tax=unclassified Streptomyces TaxID=2593676 RepID=UPI00089D3637|nr:MULTISPECIES: hypothetical protein [unclassified Streptomyces]PKW09263.1 hypothetical protein BX260_4511 [Streptomyces sp. 5112.2]SEC40139.1 hypothetical protein SAMN05428944_3582 [Streptomyces sp. 1222.5]
MAEFRLNATTNGDQHLSAATAVLGSEFLTLWSDDSTFTVRGRFVGTTGSLLGDEFPVGTQPPGGAQVRPRWPSVLSVGSNQFAVWLETPFNTPGRSSVRLQRFTDGHPAGPAATVTDEADSDGRPALSLMIDGGVLVTWAGTRFDQRIRARRFSPEGQPKGAELAVNTTEGFHLSPATTLLEGGDWVAAWTTDPHAIGGNRLNLRFFDFEGNALTSEIAPNVGDFQGVNALTLLDSGQFVAATISHLPDSDLGQPQTTVRANIFKTDGSMVADFTAGNPKHFTRTSPALSHLPGGRFLMTWIEESADTFSTVPTVMAVICSEDEGRLTDPVPVSTATSGKRFNTCAATAFGNGAETALITWDDTVDPGGDTGLGVHGRTFHVTSPGILT